MFELRHSVPSWLNFKFVTIFTALLYTPKVDQRWTEGGPKVDQRETKGGTKGDQWGGGGRGWYKLKVKPTWDRMSQLKLNLDLDILLPVSKYLS